MALGILIKMFLVGTIYSMIFFINKIFFNSCNLFGAVEKINKWTHGQHFHNKMVSLNEGRREDRITYFLSKLL